MSSRSRLVARFRASPLADFALILVASAVAVGVLGLLRLGRQFPAAAASPSLLVPFLLPVLALALEAAALVALSAAQLRELTRRPARLAVRSTLPLLGLAALVLGAAELIPRGTEHPGAFANELVQTARASCGPSGSVPVPLLGLTVSCKDGGRIVGPMPGVRSIELAMQELTFSDDLRRVEIAGLELTAARALRVHLVAGRARIAGLAPWSRSPRLTPLQRYGILAALGSALWLAAGLAFRPRVGPAREPVRASEPETPAGDPGPGARARRGARWLGALASLLFAVPGGVTAASLISLDQERAAPMAYAAAAAWGLVALAGLQLLARRVPRIFSSFSAF